MPVRARPALSTLFAAAAALAADAAIVDPREMGRRLFNGEAPLAAQIAGQDLALPPQATRCTNCHADAPGRRGSEPRRSFAPALSAEGLRRSQPRRGGPPSSYDVASMCRLLRTGIDPASVIVDRNMPRYEITTADCDALWVYLAGPPP
jgi:hypothetical protein